MKPRQINIRLEERKDTPMGIPNGKTIWTTIEAPPFTQIFRGCPLGRGYSKANALLDFVRRANADDSQLKLKIEELNVTETVYLPLNEFLTK